MGQPPNPVSQLQQVQNALQAPGSARYNLLTNGGFEIWQRGNGPFSAANVFTADRWYQGIAGSDTLSTSRSTANVDIASMVAAACTFTLGSGGGGSAIYQQVLTPAETTQYRGLVLSFTLRVYCTTANAVRLSLNDGTQTYSDFNVALSGWQTLHVTKTISPTANQILCMMYFAATCAVNIDNAMLVIGSVPADYAPLHPADDLARCQRYYELMAVPGETTVYGAVGTAHGAAAANVQWPYKVTKGVAPTITTQLPFNIFNPVGPVNTAVTAVTPVSSWRNSTLLGINVASGLTVGTGLFLSTAAGGQVAAEANP